MANEFGSAWTLIKLEIISDYIKSYLKVMKHNNFKLCYIDAFAGSGRVSNKIGADMTGSALRALDFAFDRYVFFEKDESLFMELKDNIENHPEYEKKKDSIIILRGDCNNALSKEITEFNKYWRGVAFLDPYAMDLDWTTLEQLKKTGIFDIWYLIPYMAIVRNLEKSTERNVSSFNAVTRIFGTEDWFNCLYKKDTQNRLFESESDNETFIRVKIDKILEYIKERLGDLFRNGLLEHFCELKNSKNSTIFLLSFACSNPAPRAQAIAKKIAGHLMNTPQDKFLQRKIF